MSKKRRKRNRQKVDRHPTSRRFVWVALAATAVAVFIGAIVLLANPGSSAEPSATPQVSGAPRLMVDQSTVDEGYLTYDTPIRTTFRLSNVGDQPLEILGTPQVGLVRGC
jgi:hypothetical protein